MCVLVLFVSTRRVYLAQFYGRRDNDDSRCRGRPSFPIIASHQSASARRVTRFVCWRRSCDLLWCIDCVCVCSCLLLATSSLPFPPLSLSDCLCVYTYMDLILYFCFIWFYRRLIYALGEHMQHAFYLSVCLSHSWIVSTRFDLRSWFLHHMVAPSF